MAIIENNGRILAIEVNSGQGVTQDAFKHIVGLQGKYKKKVMKHSSAMQYL